MSDKTSAIKNHHTLQPGTPSPNATHSPSPQPDCKGDSSETKTARGTVHNLLIIDASGSMQAIYYQALNGLNETLQTIRHSASETPEIPQTVTLVSFNSWQHREIYDMASPGQTADLVDDQYITGGMTPLYDAIGRCVNKLRNSVNADDKVLVTIITDGEENSSAEYSRAAIAALISDMRAKGWIFTYIGANQDLERVSRELNIRHTAAFRADASGTQEMFREYGACRSRWFDKCRDNAPAEELDEDFFS